MSRMKIGILSSVVIFLCAALGFCEGLSDSERKIYYDAAWKAVDGEYQLSMDESDAQVAKVEAQMRQFLTQNGLTEAQLEDIIERGNNMPFTADEEQVSQELKTKITDNLTPDQIIATLNSVASEHGMSIGQVSSIFTRGIRKS